MIVLIAVLALAQERVDHIALTGREAIVGNPTAPWTIVQYSDWQCSHCARAFARLDAYVPTQPDVRVVFKTYPLTSECNPGISSMSSPVRCTLAAGGVCANQQGEWLEYARWAFGQQASLGSATRDDLVAAAPGLGLDAKKFGQCLDSPAAAQLIRADAVEGVRLGIQGTPTLYVLDPKKGDWVRSESGVEGAISLVHALRDGVVEQP